MGQTQILFSLYKFKLAYNVVEKLFVNSCDAISLYNKTYPHGDLDNRVVRSVPPSQIFLRDIFQLIDEIYHLTTTGVVSN